MSALLSLPSDSEPFERKQGTAVMLRDVAVAAPPQDAFRWLSQQEQLARKVFVEMVTTVASQNQSLARAAFNQTVASTAIASSESKAVTAAPSPSPKDAYLPLAPPNSKYDFACSESPFHGQCSIKCSTSQCSRDRAILAVCSKYAKCKGVSVNREKVWAITAGLNLSRFLSDRLGAH